VTSPTAPAAGVHQPWARVPGAVRAWAERLGGGTPTTVRDLSGGFSPGATTVLEWPDRAFFVKAVGTELNPDSPGLHRREAVISAALPETPRFPRLRGTYDDGDWVALAFDVVAGRPPRHPWDASELDLVARGLSAMHDELTPSPVPSLEPLAGYAHHLFGGWADLASQAAPPVGLDPWAAAHLSRLAELEAGWPGACAGSTLVHGDVRSDNVLVAGDAVVFVDWPHGAVGNPAFDFIGWAPSVVLEGGPPPEELLARHDLPGAGDPGSVTVLLCAIAGFFVSHSLRPAPPGLPTLRPFQAAQGEVALAWLRRRTSW
jgi:aminoglycoside phosphotransferase (APT) family kinase protein